MTGFTATNLPVPSRGVTHQVCDLGYLQRAVTGTMLTSVTVLPSPGAARSVPPDSTSDGSPGRRRPCGDIPESVVLSFEVSPAPGDRDLASVLIANPVCRRLMTDQKHVRSGR